MSPSLFRPAVLALLVAVQAGTLVVAASAAVDAADRHQSPVAAVLPVAPPPPVVAVAEPVRRVVRPVVVRPRAVVRPAVVHRPRPHKVTVRRTRAVVRPVRHVSFATLMDQAIARIPGYVTGDATWTITAKYGHWGVADLPTGAIYIDPDVPPARIYDVVAHEWSHVLSVRVYNGDVNTAMASFNSWFGGSGIEGTERAADCMARELGAVWTHYTPCTDAKWRAGAKTLLSGKRL